MVKNRLAGVLSHDLVLLPANRTKQFSTLAKTGGRVDEVETSHLEKNVVSGDHLHIT
jgi:hypothetical protein